jgi:hypothetical protein
LKECNSTELLLKRKQKPSGIDVFNSFAGSLRA